MPRLRSFLWISAAAVLAGGIGLLCAGGLMFPSSKGLPWPKPLDPLPANQKAPSSVRLYDVIGHLPDLRFEGPDEEAFKEVSKYKYLRDSPYLAADRESARLLFSVAAGKVLVDEDLSQVAHASSHYEGRQAIYLPSGRSFEFEVDLPQPSQLSFGFTTLPPFEEVSACGGELSVWAIHASEKRLLTQKTLTATREAFSWQDLGLDLEPGLQKIRFETQKFVDCNGFTQAFISTPRIFSDRTPQAVEYASKMRASIQKNVVAAKVTPQTEEEGDAGDAPLAPAENSDSELPLNPPIHAEPVNTDPPLNVLYINICTFRQDDVGAYGNPWPTTPRIDALAREGVRFSEARSNSNWSKGSQISALLGRYPSATGLRFFTGAVGPFERQMITHLAWPSLPERFREAGYESIALVDNVFLGDFLHVGVDLGFERFTDNARHLLNGVELTAQAVDLIDHSGDRPFFLYINIANPHYKYRPPRDILFDLGLPLGEFLKDPQHALHWGEVAFADRMVGVMVDALEARGLRDRTLIVIHADHGEIIEEDRDLEITQRGDRPGAVQTFPHTRFKHGWTWFEAEQRVPLILNWPHHLEPQVIDRPVTLVDVAPTIFRLAGLEPPKTLQGQDLLNPKSPYRPSLLEGKQFDSIVAGRHSTDPHHKWKLVRFHKGLERWRRMGEEQWNAGPQMLFDLASDPMERQDVSGRERGMMERLSRQLHDLTPPTEFLYFFAFEGEGHFRGSIDFGTPLERVTLRGHARPDRVEQKERSLTFEVTGNEHTPPILAVSAKFCMEIKLSIEKDGQKLDAGELLLGPYGLPLVQGEGDFLLPEMGLLAVGAGQIPQLNDGQAVRIWSERINRGGPEPFGAVQVDSSVMDAMKDWGYAH